ncbi:MAG: anhydro-N-acetylmuramic acid kinase, partial [Pseudomonadota bacterium]
MSGTSIDSIDAALIEIEANEISTVASLCVPYSETLQHKLKEAIHPKFKISLHDFASLNIQVGEAFANACIELLDHAKVNHKEVSAIGSHGQTLRHSPNSAPPYTLQIGDGATIAARTNINTVVDFRSADLAMGGEGAPLVPAFHESIFRSAQENRVILNIGGIANISELPKDLGKDISGFDTGPGNCLLDDWIQQCRG